MQDTILVGIKLTFLLFFYHHITDLLFHYLHLGSFFPASDGISLKRELVLPDDSPAVFVPDVGDHIHIRSPHLKLSLPVNDGGQRGTDQEGTFGVALQ